MKAKLEALCEKWEKKAGDYRDDAKVRYSAESSVKLYNYASLMENCAADLRALIASMEDAPLPGEVGARKECE